jgi:hypothetical protein
VLEGRVRLFQSNFGQANQAFDAARTIVLGAQTRLRQLGEAVKAGQLEVAIAQLREAQRLSLALDGAAQTAADDALRAIDLPWRRQRRGSADDATGLRSALLDDEAVISTTTFRSVRDRRTATRGSACHP